MKKNYLLSAAAAFLLAVTGCSDDIENGGNSAGARTATVSWKSSMALMRVRCMMLISSW